MDGRDDDMMIAERVHWWRCERRLTQQALADRSGFSQSHISKIESGMDRLDSRATIERLARALNVSYADLTGQPMLPETPAQQLAHSEVNRVRVALVSSSLADGADVQPRPYPVLADLVSWAADAWQDCDYVAASTGLGPAVAELYQTYHQHGPDAAAALETLVVALDVAAYTARVLGHFDLAYLAAERKLEAAREVGRPDLVGWSRYALSQMVSASGGGYPDARQVALRTCERAADELSAVAQGRALEMLGMLHLAAMEHDVAAGGDGRTHLREATDLAARTGDGTHLRMYFGPTNVGIWSVHIAAEQRDPVRLAEAADQVNLALVPSRARRAMYWQHLGVGLAQDRATEGQAVRALLKAEQFAPGQLRLDPLAREVTAQMLTRARASAGGEDLVRLARHAGLVPLP